MLGGQQITPAYNQLYDLDSQKAVFSEAINNNNRALAKFLFSNLIDAFQGTYVNFQLELKTYLFDLARHIAPHTQLETMLFLCDLRCNDERVLSLTNEQRISLMIASPDDATFLYFLATSDMTMTDLLPHLASMSDYKRQEITNLFDQQEEQELGQENRRGLAVSRRP